MYVKALAVRCCATLLYYSGLVACARWWSRRAGHRLIILNYHRATDCDLRSHLRYLRRHYRMLHLEQALEELYSVTDIPPPRADRRTPLVVTFDDGYHDNYTHAATLARELRVPLTIFLIPGYLDDGARFWWYEGTHLVRHSRIGAVRLKGRVYRLAREDERRALAQAIYEVARDAESVQQRERFLAAARRALAVHSSACDADNPLRPLTWEEVEEMGASGWISFGSHTVHHPVLANLCDPLEIRREVRDCRTELEFRLQHPVRTFAYPFGRMEHIGEDGVQAVREAGYAWALTTVRGVNTPATPPHLLHRIPIGDRHWLMLATDVSGVWPALTRLRRAMLRRLTIRRARALARGRDDPQRHAVGGTNLWPT